MNPNNPDAPLFVFVFSQLTNGHHGVRNYIALEADRKFLKNPLWVLNWLPQ